MSRLVHWHPYKTRSRHLVYGDGALSGLRVYPAGTSCLAARLPDYRVVLTFDDVSLVLGDGGWYIEGVEDPRLLVPRHVREIQDLEDARFVEDLNLAIEVLRDERDPTVPT
jgi:hypothetical protein